MQTKSQTLCLNTYLPEVFSTTSTNSAIPSYPKAISTDPNSLASVTIILPSDNITQEFKVRKIAAVVSLDVTKVSDKVWH
jgi:hypothetical protein